MRAASMSPKPPKDTLPRMQCARHASAVPSGLAERWRHCTIAGVACCCWPTAAYIPGCHGQPEIQAATASSRTATANALQFRFFPRNHLHSCPTNLITDSLPQLTPATAHSSTPTHLVAAILAAAVLQHQHPDTAPACDTREVQEVVNIYRSENIAPIPLICSA